MGQGRRPVRPTTREEAGSAATCQDEVTSPGNQVVDMTTWTKIILILALTLATLNGVDVGALLSGL